MTTRIQLTHELPVSLVLMSRTGRGILLLTHLVPDSQLTAIELSLDCNKAGVGLCVAHSH